MEQMATVHVTDIHVVLVPVITVHAVVVARCRQLIARSLCLRTGVGSVPEDADSVTEAKLR